MRIRFDVFVASLSLLGAVVVSVLAYHRLRLVERPPQEMFQRLPNGKTEFALLQNEKCIGKLSSDLETEPQTTIVSRGEMHFRVEGRDVTARLFLGAFFNAFEQLVACNFSIESENGKVQVKLLNPSPISGSLSYTFSGQHREQTFELPGPILLKTNSDGSYRLDYSALSGNLSPYMNSFSHKSFGNFNLEAAPLDGQCANFEASDERMDLDPLIGKARGFLAQARQLPFFFSLPGEP